MWTVPVSTWIVAGVFVLAGILIAVTLWCRERRR